MLLRFLLILVTVYVLSLSVGFAETRAHGKAEEPCKEDNTPFAGIVVCDAMVDGEKDFQQFQDLMQVTSDSNGDGNITICLSEGAIIRNPSSSAIGRLEIPKDNIHIIGPRCGEALIVNERTYWTYAVEQRRAINTALYVHNKNNIALENLSLRSAGSIGFALDSLDTHFNRIVRVKAHALGEGDLYSRTGTVTVAGGAIGLILDLHVSSTIHYMRGLQFIQVTFGPMKAVTVTTGGANASGMTIEGGTSEVPFDEINVITSGGVSPALYIGSGAAISGFQNSTFRTFGQSSSGIRVWGTSSLRVVAKSRILTSASDSYGINVEQNYPSGGIDLIEDAVITTVAPYSEGIRAKTAGSISSIRRTEVTVGPGSLAIRATGTRFGNACDSPKSIIESVTDTSIVAEVNNWLVEDTVGGAPPVCGDIKGVVNTKCYDLAGNQFACPSV